MLLRIHGGPDWQDYHEFEPERQLFAAKGYAVLNVNYRGSSGRDTAYQQAIFRDWGNKEVVDLLACVDEAIKEGVADPDRLGVGGWSYGGILTDYTIATTTRFKAAISGAGMGNPSSLYGIDEYILQYEQELDPPWKNPGPLCQARLSRFYTPTASRRRRSSWAATRISTSRSPAANRCIRRCAASMCRRSWSSIPANFTSSAGQALSATATSDTSTGTDKYLMPKAAK